jgi:CheY-like chemotaxis protein
MTDNLSRNPSALRILFADDDEAVTQTFSWMLEIFGHEVRVVYDGPSAIEVAKLFLPQIIMLDISLPGLNGYEVCRTLRAIPEFEKSIFIAQTGWSDPEHYERSKAAGFHHHFVKPIKIDVMEKFLASQTIKSAA